jgi:hypothetical protein
MVMAAVCLLSGAESATPMTCFTTGATLPMLAARARFARAPSGRPALGLRMQLERRPGGFDLVSGKDFDLLALRCAVIGMIAGFKRGMQTGNGNRL